MNIENITFWTLVPLSISGSIVLLSLSFHLVYDTIMYRKRK